MNNKNLKAVITRGNVTAAELHDLLFGAGGGNKEQYQKVYVLCDGVKLTELDWHPGRSSGTHKKDASGEWVAVDDLPHGDCVLVWEHTGQRTAIDRALVLQVLDDHADGKASAACREVEGQEQHGSTKSLPKSWSIGADGATLNQFGDEVN
jgi:hypothetical protein